MQYTCKKCGKVMTRKFNFTRHQAKCKTSASRLKFTVDVVPDNDGLNKKQYGCKRCSYTTTYRSNMLRHLTKECTQVTKLERFTCRVCEKIFGRESHRLRHEATVHHDLTDAQQSEIADSEPGFSGDYHDESQEVGQVIEDVPQIDIMIPVADTVSQDVIEAEASEAVEESLPNCAMDTTEATVEYLLSQHPGPHEEQSDHYYAALLGEMSAKHMEELLKSRSKEDSDAGCQFLVDILGGYLVHDKMISWLAKVMNYRSVPTLQSIILNFLNGDKG